MITELVENQAFFTTVMPLNIHMNYIQQENGL